MPAPNLAKKSTNVSSHHGFARNVQKPSVHIASKISERAKQRQASPKNAISHHARDRDLSRTRKLPTKVTGGQAKLAKEKNTTAQLKHERDNILQRLSNSRSRSRENEATAWLKERQLEEASVKHSREVEMLQNELKILSRHQEHQVSQELSPIHEELLKLDLKGTCEYLRALQSDVSKPTTTSRSLPTFDKACATDEALTKHSAADVPRHTSGNNDSLNILKSKIAEKDKLIAEINGCHKSAMSALQAEYEFQLQILAEKAAEISQENAQLKEQCGIAESQITDWKAKSIVLQEALDKLNSRCKDQNDLQRKCLKQAKQQDLEHKQKAASSAKIEDLRRENEHLALQIQKLEKEKNEFYNNFVEAVHEIHSRNAAKSELLLQRLNEVRKVIV